MGLRTASVRRPYVAVMAPALTDTPQNQPPKEDPHTFPNGGAYCKEQDKLDAIDAINLSTLALVSGSMMSDQNDDKMGLQKLHEKTQEVDQILNNLTSNLTGDVDIAPPNVEELMQVIKSIENEPNTDLNIENEDLPTIEKFLTEVDMMNMSMEEAQDQESHSKEVIAELKKKQIQIQRRLDFLRRKISKLQAHHMGQHISGEIVGTFEYVNRSLKRLKDNSLQLDGSSVEDKFRAMSYGSAKTMLKKLEMAAALQANSVARQKHLPKYFGSGSVETGNHRINVPGVVNVPQWPMEQKLELQKVGGLLQTEFALVQHQVDSDATESSSGGESCDEMQNYGNPHQQYLSIQKRALWKYSTARASIAARWTWLQAQISDLEYRIRQHTDLHKQIRQSKGDIQLGGVNPPPPASPTAVNGYRGPLPGSPSLSSKALEEDGAALHPGPDYQCARTRPLVNFKKRKLLQMNGLHVISKKAARPSNIRCGCVEQSCAVCTGRKDPTHPRDPPDALSKAERIALVDPGFHPVFSLPDDVSYGVHCEAIMKTPEWQQRSTRISKVSKVLKNNRPDKAILEHRSKKLEHRKKYNRLLKPSTASALSAKLKSKIRGRKTGRFSSSSAPFRKRSKGLSQLNSLVGDGIDEELESLGNHSNLTNSAMASPSLSPLLHIQAISGYNRRSRADSYDIDNIVIPYSVAAATRVEKLQYKEILTPKWRIAEPDFKCDTKNNGPPTRSPSQDSDAEDLSEDAVVSRHDKSEHDEKKKFLSYLKFPLGHGRSRSHKRTDSLAESSGANTPDPMSPHPIDPESAMSPMTSPPATPLPSHNNHEEVLPSISAMRRRTISQSRFGRDREVSREENNTPETIEVAPFDTRTFPLEDDMYEKMLKNMPENHQFQTNARAQDSTEEVGFLELDKVDSPGGSESTESAIGDEDPNDPEWIDLERSRDRHKR